MITIDILKDVLASDLKIVFCGTAAGKTSGKIGAYYARQGNQFWPVLFQLELTPKQLAPDEYKKLLLYGIGLTDLVKNKAGMDNTLSNNDYDARGMEAKILQYKPQVLCFNGKKAAKTFLKRKIVFYGPQQDMVDKTNIFILSSTSPGAKRYWNYNCWECLVKIINNNDDDITAYISDYCSKCETDIDKKRRLKYSRRDSPDLL